MSNIKIATWNLCLGLGSKKDLVQKYILENNIDICCVQETEIDNNFMRNFSRSRGIQLRWKKTTLKEGLQSTSGAE
jgi:exonuclease III